MSEIATVRKDDLDVLIAACTSYLPHDVSPEVGVAFSRMLTAFDETHADDDPPPPDARQWAVLELMGHRQAIGTITETRLAGRQMITVDRIDTVPASTQHYGPESVYCLTPVTEAQARELADSRYKTHIVPPALNAAAYVGEDDVEVFSADEVWGADESDAAARDDRAAMVRDARAPCCDLHGRNCEPPSELCCENCTEVRHCGWADERGNWRYGHPDGEVCASPDLSTGMVRDASGDPF